MRVMIIRKADKNTEAGMMPTQELLAAMMKYNEEMVNAGVMLSGDGLHRSAKGARVKFSDGKPTVIDGPFAETKELIAGFSILKVNSLEEAIEWVKRWPSIDKDENGDLEIEIRPFIEAEDFGPEFTPEMRAHEERLRERAGKK